MIDMTNAKEGMTMSIEVLSAVLIPFLGTVLGSAGVMVAASIWSLNIPAMDQSAHMGKLAFLPFCWHWTI